MSKLMKYANFLVIPLCNRKVCRTVRPYLKDLYYRRLAQGPEEFRPRSDWLNWNREAELFAFTHRISEELSTTDLEKIFTDKSYIDCIAKTSKTDKYIVEGNGALAAFGKDLSQRYITAFLHHIFPQFPNDWIQIICNHLLSPSELAFIGAHLGIGDLVLYSNFNPNKDGTLKFKMTSSPPSLDIIANTLMALVGTLAKLKVDRAESFVNDFILVRLTDYDLIDLIQIPNPIKMLTKILAMDGRGPPEFRLQNQCGMNTILACYQVAIYSNHELIGEAPGETISIAEDEAARQAIRSYYGLTENRPPLILSSRVARNTVQLTAIENPNPPIDSYLLWRTNLETACA